ncbi:N-acetyltransferase [Citricoccus sp. SGAir0253]|uniref:GNAT family N-acetyltransferase n=1 Tax=Citricoccus sp. SGAir0253 TaxID=2567881 RepID=UPI0010CD3CA9|nr:GNAT family N-acetyltransferase [Citricoccus sp. SGAir0253]QCU77431.1 N-acetyltransferase [Citricoccus sp. SGAir0253]
MTTGTSRDLPKIVHDDLRVVRDPDRGRIELWQRDRFIGFLGYAEAETADGEQSVVVLQHTIIDEAYGRRGYARALVTMVLERLRAEGFLIVPECTYVQDYLTRYPEYAPLVYEGPLREEP